MENGLFELDNFYANTFFGEDSSIMRKNTIANFVKSQKSIICCVFCLGEGWDLPLLDGVVFGENMTSGIRIVQAALRPCRKNQIGKIAKIIIPILYTEDLLTNEDNNDFKKIKQILYQMGLDDVSIYDKVNAFNISTHRSSKTSETSNGINIGTYDAEITEKLRLGMIERTQSKLSYTRIKTIIADKCETMEDYLELCKNDFRLPKNPEQYFGNEFVDWIDYLNIPQKYYNLQECKKACQKILQENPALQNKIYSDILKEMKQMDNNFPPPEFWPDYYKVNRIGDIIGYISILKRRKKFTIHSNNKN